MKLQGLILGGALLLGVGTASAGRYGNAVSTDPDDVTCIAAEKQFASDIGGCLGYADTAQARDDCYAANIEWTYPNGGVQACVLAEINEINSQQKK